MLLLLASSSTSKTDLLLLTTRRLRRSQRPSRMKNKIIRRQPIRETIPTSTDCGVVSTGSAVVADDDTMVVDEVDDVSPVFRVLDEGEV